MSPEEIAKQLRKPSGEDGARLAHNMSKISAYLIRLNYEHISKYPGNTILELGFGNGELLPELLKMGNEEIIGVDYSKDMCDLASRLNEKYIKQGLIKLYNEPADSLLLEDNSVDKIITINTIYFWDNPVAVIKELGRVLKPGGYLGVGFRTRESVGKLEFTKHNFTLYSPDDIIVLFRESNFIIEEVIVKNDGEYDAACIVLRKQS